MKPKKPQQQHQADLFRSRLDQILDRKHPLFILANQIDWSVFDNNFGRLYADKGRQALPTQLMIGLHYLKHAYNENDESVVARLLENPYWQHFCGFEFFIHRLTTLGPLRRGRKSPGVLRDQQIKLNGISGTYRKVCYLDEETGITYEFLTNALDLPAATVAQLYKERWQIELFFKCIKQNLRVKSFLRTSFNAVMTPLWVALCAYLVLAFLKFQSKFRHSMQQMLRLLQLFVRAAQFYGAVCATRSKIIVMQQTVVAYLKL